MIHTKNYILFSDSQKVTTIAARNQYEAQQIASRYARIVGLNKFDLVEKMFKPRSFVSKKSRRNARKSFTSMIYAHGGRNNAKTTDIESIDFGSRIWKTSSLFRLAYNKNDIQVGFCFSALKLESEKYGVYGAVYPLPEYLNRWYKHAFAFAELDKPEVVVFKMIDQYPGILFHIRRMCTDRPLYEEGFAVLAKTANEG